MINKFIKVCKDNRGKTAFVCGKRRISFSQLLTDVLKTVSLFEERGVARGERVLLFVLPSYEFYVLLFACIYYGVNVVVMDSYRDLGRVKRVMADNKIRRVFCTSLTRIAGLTLGSDVEMINISGYRRCIASGLPASTDGKRVVLTTFTSGTTGTPKPIDRSIDDLARQIDVVSKNIKIDEGDVVFAALPIYVLFVVYSGLTCVISNRISKRKLEREGVNAVLAPIAKLLLVKKSMPFVKKLFLGGAMLYEREVRFLRRIFPNAEQTYVYGASECVLMARGELADYLEHGFALKYRIDGVSLSVADLDSNGVGRIVAEGDVVLTEDRRFIGNDIGYFDEYGLHIVGRSRYSSAEHYNYVEDNRLLSENPRVKKGFSFVYGEKIYFCYEGKMSKTYDGIICVRFLRLPMDPKHRTKLDYVKVIDKICGE